MKKLLVFASLALSACSYSIKDIDTSKASPDCVRSCSTAYSQCASGGATIGSRYETLRACRESYEICINTCDRKQ